MSKKTTKMAQWVSYLGSVFNAKCNASFGQSLLEECVAHLRVDFIGLRKGLCSIFT